MFRAGDKGPFFTKRPAKNAGADGRKGGGIGRPSHNGRSFSFLGLKRPHLSSVLLAVSGLYVLSLGIKLGYEYFHYTVGFHGVYLQVIDFVPGMVIGSALLAYSIYRLKGWCLPRGN